MSPICVPLPDREGWNGFSTRTLCTGLIREMENFRATTEGWCFEDLNARGIDSKDGRRKKMDTEKVLIEEGVANIFFRQWFWRFMRVEIPVQKEKCYVAVTFKYYGFLSRSKYLPIFNWNWKIKYNKVFSKNPWKKMERRVVRKTPSEK